ncbi:MAG: AAA family ATPase [Alphaproteobacteria bacterium]|nr:AAA family ATPase [Alphaproteobacteria bacterium]
MYPFTISAFQRDFQIPFSKPITILVGDNATGKSTLLEYIAYACGFNLQGGSGDHTYQTQNQEQFPHLTRLQPCMTLSWLPKISQGFFFRSETFFNFLEYLNSPEIGDGDEWYEKNYGGRLLEKSHGESFIKLFGVRFNRKGLYLLDEPESALSPMRQLQFLKVLKNIEDRQDSQVIMVTHSPILMSYPGADIFSFSPQGIVPVTLVDCEHYQFMRRFLEKPDFYINQVLEEELLPYNKVN